MVGEILEGRDEGPSRKGGPGSKGCKDPGLWCSLACKGQEQMANMPFRDPKTS